MARTYTPRDAHALVNLVMAELTGQNANIQQVTTDNFVSVGETILTQYPMENVYNALSIPLLRTLIAARNYDDELMIFNALNSGMYSSRMRKISYLSRYAKPSGSFNTQLYTNLAAGFTAGENETGTPPTPQSTKSQWEQCPVIPKELQFGGSSVWDHGITWYKDQAKNAFANESSFLKFWEGALIENSNDIKMEKNAFRRAILLNFLAGMYDLQAQGTVCIDLTAGFNAAQGGTTYSRTDILTQHLSDFLKYFVATFKTVSKNMKKRSLNYHIDMPETINGVTYHLLRHTPYNRQRTILYEPLFIQSEANVLPEIFNPEYLETQYEGVMWWQNENDPSAISVVPSIPNFTTGVQETGTAVALEYVVGIIFDEDAIMTDFQLDDANTTTLEARKRFRNTWYSMARNGLNDFTEKACLFYMG